MHVWSALRLCGWSKCYFLEWCVMNVFASEWRSVKFLIISFFFHLVQHEKSTLFETWKSWEKKFKLHSLTYATADVHSSYTHIHEEKNAILIANSVWTSLKMYDCTSSTDERVTNPQAFGQWFIELAEYISATIIMMISWSCCFVDYTFGLIFANCYAFVTQSNQCLPIAVFLPGFLVQLVISVSNRDAVARFHSMFLR